MKNELGIEVKCENCSFYRMGCLRKIEDYCKEKAFVPSRIVYEQRIKELQEQQFTEEEAEKVERFLIHGYQMMINENKKVFSKLERMKGEQ